MARRKRTTHAEQAADSVGGLPGALDAAMEIENKLPVNNLAEQFRNFNDAQKAEAIKKLGLDIIHRKKFVLKSGREVFFDLIELNGSDEIKKKTKPHDVNGRESDNLTAFSVSDITPTIKKTQLYDAYGIYSEDGVIEVLDGTRRRFAAILTNAKFRIYVAEEKISLMDAQYISDLAKLAKPLSAREDGIRFKKLMMQENIKTQKALSLAIGVSESKITRCINAAEVSKELLSLYPDQNSLNVRTYIMLRKIEKEIEQMDYAIRKFVEACKSIITKEGIDSLFADEQIELISTVIKREFNKVKNDKSEKTQTTSIKEFNKNQYVKRKQKGDLISFEFKRISNSQMKEVEDFILKFFQD